MGLLDLPPELQRLILLQLDPGALRELASSCHHFHNAIMGEHDAADELWTCLLSSRFRTTPPTKASSSRDRHSAAPGLTRKSRDVYAQWHRQMRVPNSKYIGTRTAHFAKGRMGSWHPHHDHPHADSQDSHGEQPKLEQHVTVDLLRRARSVYADRRFHSAHDNGQLPDYDLFEKGYPVRALDDGHSLTPAGQSGRAEPSNPRHLCAWVTVHSSDDCRVRSCGMELRVMVQNVGMDAVFLAPAHVYVALSTGRRLDTNIRLAEASRMAPVSHRQDRSRNRAGIAHHETFMPRRALALEPRAPGNSTTADHTHFADTQLDGQPDESDGFGLNFVASQFVVERAAPPSQLGRSKHSGLPRLPSSSSTSSAVDTRHCIDNSWAPSGVVRLQKDDYCVMKLLIQLPGVVHEVDALERLDALCIPIHTESEPSGRMKVSPAVLRADFDDRMIWDRYELMPGGWWVRTDKSGAPGSNGL